MSEQNYLLPGHYKLISAMIYPFAGGKGVDIGNLIPSFVIEESMDNDCIRGTLNVYDTIGFLEDLPVRGEEILIIDVEDVMQKKRRYKLFIYKVNNVRIKDTNDGLIYEMHFMSYGRFIASKKKMIMSFEKYVSEIVKWSFNYFYEEQEKTCIVEDTQGYLGCVIPNYTSQQTMNFLASRAYSKDSPSCSFRFFEAYDNYYFASDEFFIKQAKENPDTIKEFTYSEAIKKDGKEFLQQMRNLSKIENANRVNTIADLYTGSYRSTVLELDLVQGKVEYKHFKYDSDKYTGAPKGKSTSVHTDKFINTFFNEQNERIFTVVKDYASEGAIPGSIRSEQYLSEIAQNRVAYKQRINSLMVKTIGPGRLDIQAGNIVNLKVPEFTSNTQNRKENKQLSGYYLVNTVINRFTRDKHEVEMKLIKYEWS